MSKYEQIIKHYQDNRLKYEHFKQIVKKKIQIFRHNLIWYLDCPKENITYEGPEFVDHNFKYKIKIRYEYKDPITKKSSLKEINFNIFFKPPEGDFITFNDIDFRYKKNMNELFDEMMKLIKQDKSIFGLNE